MKQTFIPIIEMMANKKLKINQINKHIEIVSKRESFSHRICDDLCQLLLSYLSIEDKFRFESVSKQFQRLKFNKQYVLKSFIGNSCLSYLSIPKVTKNTLNRLFNNRDLTLSAFQTLLQKCQFINEIEIISYEKYKHRRLRPMLPNSNLIIDIITKYCSQLRSISMDFNRINETKMIEFGRKFGPNLVHIDFRRAEQQSNKKYKALLRLCPNLVSINNRLGLEFESGIDIKPFVDSNQLLVSKLTKVGINCRSNDLQLIKTFVNNYKNQLKYVELFAASDTARNILMENISHFQQLEELKLNFAIKTKNQFINSMKAIAIQCKQIKRLRFNFYKNYVPLDYDLMNLMHSFKHLKQLDLNLFYHNRQRGDQQITSQLLNDCKQLTNFRICSENINDYFFKDIDLYLPQLKHLDINTKKIANIAMNWISKLTNLKTLTVMAQTCEYLPQITDSGICDLVNNCPQIESLIFNSRPNITNKTIDALIGLALKKPRIRFRHYFLYLECEPYFRDSNSRVKFTSIHLESYHNLPQNLLFLDDWKD